MVRRPHANRAAEHQPERPLDLGRRAVLGGAVRLWIAGACGHASSLALANALEIGQLAPSLVLHTLDGKSIATRDLLGQVVIVTFWATWCEPCREELPLFSSYAVRHTQDGLRVLGFSLDGPEALPKVRDVAASLNFPVGLLGSSYAGGYGRIWQLPVTFVIDRAGRLVHNGWDDAQQPWTSEQLHRVVDPLLVRAR
jgi:peroxiredoxin